MSSRVIRVFPDVEAVSHAAADEFERCAREAIDQRGRFRVALSGGSTPQRLYQVLAGPSYHDRIDWRNVEPFWGDERAVPADHRDSNYRMAREALISRVPIPDGQIHRMEDERSDRDQAAREYQATVARVFGVDPGGPPPSFDLILLGMGPDGHTASLFPHTAGLAETGRWVIVNHIPKLTTDRMTLTYPILNRAYEVLFLVAGTDKATTLAEVLDGPPDPARLPSQAVQPSGRLLWYLDRSAAALLQLPTEG